MLILSAGLNGQLNMELVGSYDYGYCSDIWGYADEDGHEYAIVGLFTGVAILDLADPANPVEVAQLSGAASGWRDIKTWGQYAYVINETDNGLMVIDLSDLPNSASAVDWSTKIDPASFDSLRRCHNLYIDEFGYAYLAGCNLNSGGLLFVDVFTEPGSPKLVGIGDPEYSHDVYVRENLCYSSEISSGKFSIYDVTDKMNYEFLGSQTTSSFGAHNAWLNDAGNVLFTADEVPNAAIGSYDISDPTNIIQLDLFKPLETLGQGVIPHNVHVLNDWIIISFYSDGCIVLDGSKPDNLVEVANFDTYFEGYIGFEGMWGVYPYLPSGLVVTSNIDGRVNVLAPTYVRACWLEGEVYDAETQLPINNATVKIVDTNVFESTLANGEFATGYAIEGTYLVEITATNYEPAMVEVSLKNGEITELRVDLMPISSSIEDYINDEFQISVRSNPTINAFQIDFAYPSTNTNEMFLEIYDQLGDVVEKQNVGTNSGTLEMGGNINTGLYLLALTDGINRSEVLKLIKL